MNDLNQSNKKLAEIFRAKLNEKINRFISLDHFADTGEIDLQHIYLEFKKRISGFVDKETDALKKELRYTFNSHLLLLKNTALVDTVLQTSYRTALQLYNRIHQKQIGENDVPLAIVARGGYGREEMYFRSDVDIQIVSKPVKAQEDPQRVREILNYFEYLFIHQDIFPTASSATFTETSIEGEEFDTQKISTLISLLEHRLVAGNTLVYNEFKSSIRTTSLLHMEDIIKECMTHRTYYEVQNTVFQQEPNIKEELRRPYWALSLARLRHKMESANVFQLLSELYETENLSAPAFKNMHSALNFLSRIRLFLHLNQSGGHTDVLSYEIRERVAKFMGYDLDRFYREYFYHVTLPLKRYSRNLFWESVTFENGKVTHLSEHFSLNANRQIIFRENVPPPAMEASEWIFEIISWVAKKDYYLSYPVICAIEQNLDQMSPIFLDPESKAEIQASFNQIINGKYYAKAIRLLHEFDLLANHLIPEFKSLCGLLQDIYVHQFPTDIHILSALDALNTLEVDENADPFLVDLYQSVRDKTTLKLGVMLHDIGKGAKRSPEQNEEMLGAKMAPHILENLGFGHKHRLVKDIQFLIEEHLKMRDLMHLDPDEDETYELIWDLVNQDKERLKMLILLTYADRGGTKMKMSATQIDQLKHFYQHTLYYKKRASVPNGIKLDFLKMIRLPRNLQSQMNVYNEFIRSSDRFAMELFYNPDGASDLVICALDRKGFLYHVAIVLFFNQLSIQQAKIHTQDSNVFDIFKVVGSNAKPIEYSNYFFIQKQVREDLRRIFIEKESLASVFKGRTLAAKPNVEKFKGTKAKIKIIGRSVKVETEDIRGSFMMAAKVFSDMGMYIERAVIHTQHGYASNVFYIRPKDVTQIILNEERFLAKLNEAQAQLRDPKSILLETHEKLV